MTTSATVGVPGRARNVVRNRLYPGICGGTSLEVQPRASPAAEANADRMT